MRVSEAVTARCAVSPRSFALAACISDPHRGYSKMHDPFPPPLYRYPCRHPPHPHIPHPTLDPVFFNISLTFQALLTLARGCELLAIDINGNRSSAAVAHLVVWARRELCPRLIVVKNSALHDLLAPREPADGSHPRPALAAGCAPAARAAPSGWTFAASPGADAILEAESKRYSKDCDVCGVTMVWRARFAQCWPALRYCSERCRAAANGQVSECIRRNNKLNEPYNHDQPNHLGADSDRDAAGRTPAKPELREDGHGRNAISRCGRSQIKAHLRERHRERHKAVHGDVPAPSNGAGHRAAPVVANC